MKWKVVGPPRFPDKKQVDETIWLQTCTAFHEKFEDSEEALSPEDGAGHHRTPVPG